MDPLSEIYQGAFVSFAPLAEECQFLPLSTVLIALQDILEDLLALIFCLVFEDQLLLHLSPIVPVMNVPCYLPSGFPYGTRKQFLRHVMF